MQLAEYIEVEDLFLVPAIQRIREKHRPTTGAILSLFDECPIFDLNSPVLESSIMPT